MKPCKYCNGTEVRRGSECKHYVAPQYVSIPAPDGWPTARRGGYTAPFCSINKRAIVLQCGDCVDFDYGTGKKG